MVSYLQIHDMYIWWYHTYTHTTNASIGILYAMLVCYSGIAVAVGSAYSIWIYIALGAAILDV